MKCDDFLMCDDGSALRPRHRHLPFTTKMYHTIHT
jgi:hypothetical protein